MYAEAMTHIPGNDKFQDRIEYSTIVRYYFGKNWYNAAQLGLNGALQSLNIISIIQSAQVMDNLIAAIFGKSCAINITPFANKVAGAGVNGTDFFLTGSTDFFSCIDTSDVSNGNAWGCHVVLTFGFILTAAMAIPCGRWNLDDNMIIQRVAFWLTVLCWIFWMVATIAKASSLDTLPGVAAVNTNPQTGALGGVVGNILFNFGFVTTVPSWINEKMPNVSVNKSLWSATSICIAIYLAIGIPGAIVFSDVLQGPVTGTCPRQVNHTNFNCPNDLMQTLTQGGTAPWGSSPAMGFLLKASVYMFPIVAVVSSIPVFSIVIKYNLVENGYTDSAGFFWGVLFPWLIAFPLLYMPNVLAQFVNFTSLIFVSFTDFIVPFSLYVELQHRQLESNRDDVKQRMSSTSGSLPASPVKQDSNSLYEHLYAGEEAAEGEFAYHTALTDGCGKNSPDFKIYLSWSLGIILLVLSCVGFVLSIEQGSYAFNSQVCALVGN